MKTNQITLILLLFIGIVTSCKKDATTDSTINDVVDKENIRLNTVVPSTKVNATLSGTISDESGVPLSDVKVWYGSTSVVTDVSGNFSFGSLAVNAKYAVVRAEKAGYLDGFRTIIPIPATLNTISIKLMSLGTPKTFEATTGGKVTVDTKIDVTFSANSIITEDGKAYSGTVSVYGRYLDPASPVFQDIMPGSLTGLTNANTFTDLISYGMINVELKDAAGNKLEIAKNQTAAISMPAPSGSPDTIPFWHFNETYGLWVESGKCIKSGSNYIGNVNHFTPWNCDMPPPPICGGPRMSDIDGNVYNVIKIGSQCWMAENLKTTRYSDGSAIATGLSDADWKNTTSGAYAIYDNDPANNLTYGKLYNWYAVKTGKLAPLGWHIPTNAEWTTLTTYLGGELVAGSKMKSTTLWTPYSGIVNTNSSGFSGLPGGFRKDTTGAYEAIRDYGCWWSSTDFSPSGYARSLSSQYNYVTINGGGSGSGSFGQSVRCVRD